MSRYRSGLLISIVFVCFVLCTFIVTRVSSLQNPDNKLLAVRENQEEATHIREGVLSAKQRAHGKLFKHNGPKLRDLAKQMAGPIEVVSDVGLVLDNTPIPGNPLEGATCNADAVVVGVTRGKASQVNEEGNFIFTDLDVTVEEVVKNNPLSGIEPNQLVSVTRPGGAVEFGGRVFRARREDFKPTPVGRRYLFFLKYVPETQSYLAYGNGTFELNDKKVAGLGDAPELRAFESKDPATLLGEVRTFAAAACPTNK
ncbi:MAG TPA: hypothetical protein VM864_04750 [Pyrinomonadaceae bacterium]|jgi:hypothetical protein|nr:hypothetical protein [Pyrinomonadaceae bacterium]